MGQIEEQEFLDGHIPNQNWPDACLGVTQEALVFRWRLGTGIGERFL